MSPPTPPAQHNLQLIWWQDTKPPTHHPQGGLYPPADTGSANTTITYRCKQTGVYNRWETNFNKNTYQLTCLPNNTFSTPAWPNCVSSR